MTDRSATPCHITLFDRTWQVAAPFDLLKSRVMASTDPTDGLLSVLGRLLRQEGPFALFNGWWPTYLRLGPHAVLTFPLFEAMRRAFGLDYL